MIKLTALTLALVALAVLGVAVAVVVLCGGDRADAFVDSAVI